MIDQLNLSETEWRRRLTPSQYHVLREAATEPAFSGALTDNTGDGTYHCTACHLAVFDSADKYDSGAGWPSFTRPIDPLRVTEHGDTRIEARCARCDSHLGHAVPDGPPPLGLRYCINAIALEFRARPSA